MCLCVCLSAVCVYPCIWMRRLKCWRVAPCVCEPIIFTYFFPNDCFEMSTEEVEWRELAATRSTCAGVFVREAKGSSQSSRWLWQRSLGGLIIWIAATAVGESPWCWLIISVFKSFVSVISFFICPHWRHQSQSLPDLFQMNPSFYRLFPCRISKRKLKIDIIHFQQWAQPRN